MSGVRLVVLVVTLAALAGCRSDLREPTKGELSVLAASSLTEAFQDLAHGFEAAHPDVDVRLTFAGSQVLRLQIEQGAPVDVFASANEAHLRSLVGSGHVVDARVFAQNELALIVPPDNPAGIDAFSDWGKASRIVLGTDSVPVGAYTRQMLRRAGEALGQDFVSQIRQRIVSEESNVRLIRAKVEMGEAEAAVVYRTDVAGSDRVRQVLIPAAFNVRASYPIGRGAHASDPQLAEQFVTYVLSPPGQEILRRRGFVTEEQ